MISDFSAWNAQFMGAVAQNFTPGTQRQPRPRQTAIARDDPRGKGGRVIAGSCANFDGRVFKSQFRSIALRES